MLQLVSKASVTDKCSLCSLLTTDQTTSPVTGGSIHVQIDHCFRHNWVEASSPKSPVHTAKANRKPHARAPLKCPQCSKIIHSALSRHIRLVHSKEKTISCKYCQEKFQLRHDLARHIKAKHSSVIPSLVTYQPTPNKRVRSPSDIVLSNDPTTNETNQNLQPEGNEVGDSPALKQEDGTATKTPWKSSNLQDANSKKNATYSCALCPKTYSSKQALFRHNSSQHSHTSKLNAKVTDETKLIVKEVKLEKAPSFTECTNIVIKTKEFSNIIENFESMGSALMDKSTKNTSQELTCTFCKIVFVQKKRYENHMLIKHKNKQPLLADVIKQPENVDIQNSHDSTNSFSSDIYNESQILDDWSTCQCQKCPSKFVSESALKAHLYRKHSIIKIEEPSTDMQEDQTVETPASLSNIPTVKSSITVHHLSNETVNQLSNETVNHLSNQTVNHLSNETVDQLSNETVNHLSNEPVNHLSNKTVNHLSNDKVEHHLVDTTTASNNPAKVETPLDASLLTSTAALLLSGAKVKTHLVHGSDSQKGDYEHAKSPAAESCQNERVSKDLTKAKIQAAESCQKSKIQAAESCQKGVEHASEKTSFRCKICSKDFSEYESCKAHLISYHKMYALTMIKKSI